MISVVEAPSLESTIDFGGWLGGHYWFVASGLAQWATFSLVGWMWCWPFLIGGLQPRGPQQPCCWQSPSYFQSERLTLPSNKMGQKSRHKREKMRERMRKDDGKVMACWLAGNHFTCYRKPLKSLKPPPERPGLLLLNRNGRHVIGAPLINPELGKPPVSHGGYLYLKTTARDARNYCDSAPGTIRIQHGCTVVSQGGVFEKKWNLS